MTQDVDFVSNYAPIKYPLNLDRLQWAERNELIMSMREARGIIQFAAHIIGCRPAKIRQRMKEYEVAPCEYDAPPQSKDIAVIDNVLQTLKANDGNKKKTAKMLGIGRQTLYNYLEKLNYA